MLKKICDCTIQELDEYCHARGEQCFDCPLRDPRNRNCTLWHLFAYWMNLQIEIPEERNLE